jgi:hypothetical protein
LIAIKEKLMSSGPAPQRPGSLTFVAIVLIILGCISLLGALVGAPSLVMSAVTPDPGPKPLPKFGEPMDSNEIQRMIMREVPSYVPFMAGSMFLDVLFGIAQVVCGIGLWKMSASWRIPAILATLGKMLFSFGNHAYQILVVSPVMGTVMGRVMEAQMPPGPGGKGAPPMPFDFGMLMQASVTIGVIITAVVQLAIFLTITLILTSGTVKDALSGKAPPPRPGDDEELERRRSRRYEGYDDDDDAPRSSESKSPPPPSDTGITDRS